ncbi:MAG: hypothetical protein OEV33_04125, partial [Armatimonadota bacterium]|nr:hypothetical protein [Armatimonadota bacterium]
MARFFRIASWVALVAVAVVVLQLGMKSQQPKQDYDFGTFIRKVEAGEVATLVISPKNIGEGTLTDKAGGVRYMVNLPADMQTYMETVRKNVPTVEIKKPSISDVWVSGLFYLLITGLLIVGFWVFIARQTQSSGNQALSFGRSRARR